MNSNLKQSVYKGKNPRKIKLGKESYDDLTQHWVLSMNHLSA